MFERALNIFWILLGGAAAAYAWTLGLVGSSGPDSGLFEPKCSALPCGVGCASTGLG